MSLHHRFSDRVVGAFEVNCCFDVIVAAVRKASLLMDKPRRFSPVLPAARVRSLTIRYRSLDQLDEVVRRSREGVYYGAAATVCPGGKIRNKKNVAC